MKKYRILPLLLLAALLTGCGGETDPEQVITVATAPAGEAAADRESGGATEGYVFEFDGISVVTGEDLPEEAAQAAVSSSQYPSCVGSGMETLYQFEDFDITVLNGGRNALVYSIYFHSEAVSTAEGLSIGDSSETVTALYGEPDNQGGYAWIYSDGKTDLIILIAEDAVAGIEYRMAE